MGLWNLDVEEPLQEQYDHSCRRTQSALDLAVMRMYGDKDRVKKMGESMKSNYAGLRQKRLQNPNWKPSRPAICRSTWQSENKEANMADLIATLYNTEPKQRPTRPPGGFVSKRSLPTLKNDSSSLLKAPTPKPPEAPTFPFPARRNLPMTHGLGIHAPSLPPDLIQRRAAMAAR